MRPRAVARAAAVAAQQAQHEVAGTRCPAPHEKTQPIHNRGTGDLTLTLRLDQDAQAAINIDEQLRRETFLEFLRPDLAGWSAPGEAGKVFSDRTDADGTRVFETTRTILSTPDDVKEVLGRERPIDQIVQATGVYALGPTDGTDTGGSTSTGGTLTALPPVTATGTAAGPGATLTDLPATVPLQSVLVMRFQPQAGPPDRKPATFTFGIRGGVGEVGDATCGASRGAQPTTADLSLRRSLGLDYQYTLPVPAESASDGATRSGNRVAWDMNYGTCDLMEASSAGASSSAAVNGLILGGAVGFILIVLGLRILSRRRNRRTPPPY